MRILAVLSLTHTLPPCVYWILCPLCCKCVRISESLECVCLINACAGYELETAQLHRTSNVLLVHPPWSGDQAYLLIFLKKPVLIL